jgi:hypothetical protein
MPLIFPKEAVLTPRPPIVDVVGGGLLYKAKQFSFTPGLMLNYLWVVRASKYSLFLQANSTIRISSRDTDFHSLPFRRINVDHFLLDQSCPQELHPIHPPRYQGQVPYLLTTKQSFCHACRMPRSPKLALRIQRRCISLPPIRSCELCTLAIPGLRNETISYIQRSLRSVC